MRKVGPHIIASTPQALAWARHAPIVKSIGSTGPFEIARDDAWRVFRRYFTEWEQNDLSNPQGTFNAIMEQIGPYRHPKLVSEVLNEKYQFLGTGLYQYAEFLQKIVPLFHNVGIKVAVPSWSSGAFNIDEIKVMREKYQWCRADFQLHHAYWANYGFTIYNALRPVQWWEEGDPPILITECGRDSVRDMPGGGMSGNGGWKTDNLSREQYIAELEGYDRELQKYDCVVGATVFTAGATSDWGNYSTDGLDIPAEIYPVPDIPPNNGGNGTMPEKDGTLTPLANDYQAVYDNWIDTGGDPGKLFNWHLIGIGAKDATEQDVADMTDMLKSLGTQLNNLVVSILRKKA